MLCDCSRKKRSICLEAALGSECSGRTKSGLRFCGLVMWYTDFTLVNVSLSKNIPMDILRTAHASNSPFMATTKPISRVKAHWLRCWLSSHCQSIGPCPRVVVSRTHWIIGSYWMSGIYFHRRRVLSKLMHSLEKEWLNPCLIGVSRTICPSPNRIIKFDMQDHTL